MEREGGGGWGVGERGRIIRIRTALGIYGKSREVRMEGRREGRGMEREGEIIREEESRL